MTIDRAELIKKLPSLPDYPAIRDIAKALWGTGEVRGAAAMIGAGYSRYCEQAAGDAVLPPLWDNFSRRMASDLYQPGSRMENGDPLRLAEEYRAALGQPALDALIREMVPDRRWAPGAMHRSLLRLPWSDVLTTNWDTLLERAAAEDHERLYETVETLEAIARTRSPRIVKLHGSLPSVTPFIFTEEDFRTYPQRYAPFVNLAQQVLLENELVLLGFSGDDPNFLRWAGWVRDQLGSSARRIRLVGVLNLTPSRRRLLEGQNVTPIDLAPLVRKLDPSEQHQVANEVFLEALKSARPAPLSEWRRPSEQLDSSASEVDVLKAWTEDRLNYPGWLVAPSSDRKRLAWITERQMPHPEVAFPSLSPPVAARFLVEFAWRCSVALTPLPSAVLAQIPIILAKPDTNLDRADRFVLLLATATAARYSRDEKHFEDALVLATDAAESDNDRAAIAYERCLFFRDRLDYAGIGKHLDEISGSDPAWALRRGSMLAVLRDSQGAISLARRTLYDIRARRARDRNSLWLLSREAWAHIVATSYAPGLPIDPELDLDEWPLRYREAKCDPWDEFTNYDHDLNRAREMFDDRRASYQGSFSPGAVVRNPARRVTTSALALYDELTRVIDLAGFARIPNVDTVERRLQAGISFLDDSSLKSWSALLAVRDYERGLINECFNRLAIARIDGSVAADMVSRLRAAIEYGRARLYSQNHDADKHLNSTKWPDHLRTLLELLSRLVVQLDPDSAIDYFRWGCRLARDPTWNHWWLFEPLHHLLDHLLDAIPPHRRNEVASDILHFPMAGEVNSHRRDQHWPNIAQRLNDNAASVERVEPDWSHRITVITNLARSSDALTRSRALIMLYTLYKGGVLSEEEELVAAEAIWAVPSDGTSELPNGVDLYPSIFLELPEPKPGLAAKAFRTSVILPALESVDNLHGRSIAAATEARHPVVLTQDEARTLGVTLMNWRKPQIEPGNSVEHDFGTDRTTQYNIAGVMARAVLPSMADADIDDAFVEKLFDSITTIGPEMNEVLPWLVKRRPALAGLAFAALRRALVSRQVDVLYAAARGMWQWLRLAKDEGIALPAHVPTEIVTLTASRREPALRPALSLAKDLVAMGRIELLDQDRLIETLDILFVETAYDNQDGRDLREDTLSLVRANCFRLSAALKNLGRTDEAINRWLNAAPSDPLPEVRYALDIEDE